MNIPFDEFTKFNGEVFRNIPKSGNEFDDLTSKPKAKAYYFLRCNFFLSAIAFASSTTSAISCAK